MRARTLLAVVPGVVAALAVPLTSAGSAPGDTPAACEPGGPRVTFSGEVGPDRAKSYEVLPFDVADGTTRIEVTYDWSDITTDLPLPGTPVTGLIESTFDLGLWDADGYRDPDGFRGWSGSRGGRVATGQDPVFVQPDEAARGYHPGPIEPGTWWVDLGIAAVSPTGASWSVRVRCTAPDVGPAFEPAPVDPGHVVRDEPGWYHGDLHAHGYHSNASAPPWDDIVDLARQAGLDFLPVTDYVTGQHWDELGPVQDRNPDLLLWPGREIITYFGHAIALGETRAVLEYRHGFEDVTLAGIQDRTLADGALFGVAHPTIFPEPIFTNFCRGCEFNLGGVVDWSRVDTVEVVTGPIVTGLSELGAPDIPGLSELRITNPFVLTAIEYWERLLNAGHRITAVSGSDSKAVDPPAARDLRGIGSSATAVFARQLSRPALEAGLREGRAYVRTRGVDHSPELDVTVRASDGRTGTIGDALDVDRAELDLTIRGGRGQTLQLHRNGEPYGQARSITADPYEVTVPISRDRTSEGPLGTYVWVEVSEPLELPGGLALPELPLPLPRELDVLSVPTVIANPVFLADAVDDATDENSTSPPAEGPAVLPATGGTPAPAALMLLAVGVAAVAARGCAVRQAEQRHR